MLKDKKYYTHISQIDMIRAQEDPEFAQEILQKVEAFLNYISYIIYNYYGAKYDSSLDRDDIMAYLRMSVLQAIKAYDPSKYDPEKDKRGAHCYLDGFRYISTIAKRLVNKFHAYHHRQKRIPPEFIQSFEPEFYLEYDEMEEPSDIDMLIYGMLEQYNGIKHKGNNIKDIIEMLFSGSTHSEISNKFNIKKKDIEKILFYITRDGEMETSQLTFEFFNSKRKR